MYAIRELLVTLIFAAFAFGIVFIPYLICSCLVAVGQSWLVRNAKLLFATSTAIHAWLNYLRDDTRRAGETIREAALIAWLR